MKKRKNYRKILIAVFLVTILSISIGYARLKQNVKIEGKATIQTQENEEGKLIVTYVIDSRWETGGRYYYKILMTISNNTSKTVNGWNVSIVVPQRAEITAYYNTNYTLKENRIIFENVSYNAQILSKQSTVFEYHIATTDSNYNPSDIIINETQTTPPTEPENPDKPDETIKKAEISINKGSWWQSENYYINQYNVSIKNIGEATINSWKFDIDFPEDTTIQQAWNVLYSNINNLYTLGNTSYNGTIETNNSASFGIVVQTPNQNLELNAINIVLK